MLSGEISTNAMSKKIIVKYNKQLQYTTNSAVQILSFLYSQVVCAWGCANSVTSLLALNN